MNKQKLKVAWDNYSEDRSLENRNILAEHFFPKLKPIAIKMYARYASTSVLIDIDDIVSAGSYGLITAIERYDPAKKASFTTYMFLRIRGEMIDMMRSTGEIKKGDVLKFRQVEEHRQRIQSEQGYPASQDQIEVALKEDPDWGPYQMLKPNTYSYDQIDQTETSVCKDYYSLDHGDMFLSKINPPDYDLEQDEMWRFFFDKMKDHATEIELQVAYFYIYCQQPFKVVAHCVNLTESGACQYFKSFIKKVKQVHNGGLINCKEILE